MTNPTSPTFSRRDILSTSTKVAAATLAAPFIARGAAPTAKVLETKIISKQPQYYNGWSTVARRKNGELWVTWSGGRDGHVCPLGQVHSMISRDNGTTWTWPRVLVDSAIDDRDSGVLETAKGSLIVTTFSSLAYVDQFKKVEKTVERTDKGITVKGMSAERFERWNAVHSRLNDEQRQAELGEWVYRSTDGGISWSARIPSIVNSPHGPIQLKDGRLLYAGKQLWTKDKKIGVCESKDDGVTWTWLSEIPHRKEDDYTGEYHELHAVEAADGTIIVQIRNHSKANPSWTLQTESKDGGKTWAEPRPICYGLPSHLLRLRDDRLVMTYGHRLKPFGNQARISSDNGKTWSDEIIISGDGTTGDLGYPSTVELDDGKLLTIWYEYLTDMKQSVLRQAIWQLT